mmetsp:Transcript_32558/g.54570  ORF Transcript_32558/g.54570 Transcript_32558/m.54570 type:complete len:253 (+) Transcript_32558:2511-3269(+)
MLRHMMQLWNTLSTGPSMLGLSSCSGGLSVTSAPPLPLAVPLADLGGGFASGFFFLSWVSGRDMRRWAPLGSLKNGSTATEGCLAKKTCSGLVSPTGKPGYSVSWKSASGSGSSSALTPLPLPFPSSFGLPGFGGGFAAPASFSAASLFLVPYFAFDASSRAFAFSSFLREECLPLISSSPSTSSSGFTIVANRVNSVWHVFNIRRCSRSASPLSSRRANAVNCRIRSRAAACLSSSAVSTQRTALCDAGFE